MQITSFTLAAPDIDGDVMYEVEADSVNKSPHDIRLLHKQYVFVNGRGAAFEGVTEQEQVRIEPREAFAVEPLRSHFKACHAGPERDDVTVLLYLIQCAREFHPLGCCPLPADHTQTSQLDVTLQSDCLEQDLKLVVSRRKPDEDDDVQLYVNCMVRRLPSQEVRDVALRVELIDAEGAVIAVDESDSSLVIEQRAVIDIRMSPLRTGRLKGASMRFSMVAFMPVQEEVCRSLSMPCE